MRAGAVISVPFDLARCAAAIDGAGGMTFVYRERFLRTLRAKAIAKARRFPGLPFTERDVVACRTFASFDDRVTARVHGFAGAQDYWTRCSSGRFLDALRRPLLAISAEDDPIVPSDTLPREAARRNPHLHLETHRCGGHVGFVSGPPWRFEFFAERRAATFLADALRR